MAALIAVSDTGGGGGAGAGLADGGGGAIGAKATTGGGVVGSVAAGGVGAGIVGDVPVLAVGAVAGGTGGSTPISCSGAAVLGLFVRTLRGSDFGLVGLGVCSAGEGRAPGSASSACKSTVICAIAGVAAESSAIRRRQPGRMRGRLTGKRLGQQPAVDVSFALLAADNAFDHSIGKCGMQMGVGRDNISGITRVFAVRVCRETARFAHQ